MLESGCGESRVCALRTARTIRPTEVAQLLSLLPEEGQAEEADLMQQRDGEFPGRRTPENSLADRQVRRRVGSDAPELVPCECNGRAPVEQMLTGELTAKTQRTVAEAALLLENGRGAMVPGPGTFRGKA